MLCVAPQQDGAAEASARPPVLSTLAKPAVMASQGARTRSVPRRSLDNEEGDDAVDSGDAVQDDERDEDYSERSSSSSKKRGKRTALPKTPMPKRTGSRQVIPTATSAPQLRLGTDKSTPTPKGSSKSKPTSAPSSLERPAREEPQQLDFDDEEDDGDFGSMGRPSHTARGQSPEVRSPQLALSSPFADNGYAIAVCSCNGCCLAYSRAAPTFVLHCRSSATRCRLGSLRIRSRSNRPATRLWPGCSRSFAR